MMRTTIVFAGVAVCASAGTAAARNYYVSTTGSDSAAGTSTAPLRTLQRAASLVVAGDTVIVRAGSYAGFHLTRSGAAGAEIRFLADPGVTITARNPVTTDGINLEGASYVRVEGFAVTAMPRAGVRAVLCHHVTVRRVRADRNTKWGILTGFCSDLLIEDNETSRSVQQHGIYVGNSGDRNVVRGNTVWGNYMNGIHFNGDKSAGGDGVMTGNTIEENLIYGNGTGGGSAINCDGVQSSKIRNNLLYDNHASGISLYRIDGGAASINNQIVNNTILNASVSRWVINLQNAATGTVLRNNVLWSYHSYRGALVASPDSMSGLVSNHNAVIGRFARDGSGSTVLSLSAWQSATGQDKQSFVATPTQLFENATANDYDLKTGSPAVDKGTATTAPTGDLAGHLRPQLAGYDIGAFERCGTTCAVATAYSADEEQVDDGEALDDLASEDPDAAVAVGGCSVSGGERGGLGAILALGAVLAVRRRRRT